MCIYCSTTNYRRIYKEHHGSIPKEDDGRSYEIHHIDGNHSNNDPLNLIAVTIKEHYDVHHKQGDWMACHRIAAKMKYSAKELSALASQHAKQQVINGTHPWQAKDHQFNLARKRIESGTHPWLYEKHREFLSKRETKKVKDGSHSFLGPDMNKQMLANGKHPSQNLEHRKYMSDLQRKISLKQIEDGSHNFLKLNSFIWVCDYCSKKGTGKANFNRHYKSKICENAHKKNDFT
jgi:hypothetical protein